MDQQNTKLLQNQLNQYMQQIEELEDVVESKDDYIQVLLFKNDQLNYELEKLKTVNQAYEVQRTENTLRRKDIIEVENKELQQELDSYRNKYEIEANKHQKAEQKIVALEKEINILQKNISKLNDACKIQSQEQGKGDTSIDIEQLIRQEVEKDKQHQDQMRKKKDQLNVLRTQCDKIIAENRILRTLAKVPENYGFDLTQIKLGEMQQIEDYKHKIKNLELEVEELESERLLLRARMRELSTLYSGKDNIKSLDERYRNLTDEQKFLIDDYADKVRNGIQVYEDKFQEKSEFNKEKLKLENEIQQLKEELRDEKRRGGSGGDGSINQVQFNKLSKELRNEIHQAMADARGEQGGQVISGGDGNANYYNQNSIENCQKAPVPIQSNGFEEIKKGFSFRYNQDINIDMNNLYQEGMFDQVKAKHEIASLYLQNMETIKLLQNKEKEYASLKMQTEQLKKDYKQQLINQDEMFLSHFTQLDQLNEEKQKIAKENRMFKHQISEYEVKENRYTNFINAHSGSDDEKLRFMAEMTKSSALLDINLIKVSRQYQASRDEYKDLKQTYDQVELNYNKKQLTLLEKIKQLITWKTRAKGQIKELLQICNNSVEKTEYDKLEEQYDIKTAYLCEHKFNQANFDYTKSKNQDLERKLINMREILNENILESKELEMENEILSKNLEQRDPDFAKYKEVYNKMVNCIKQKNLNIEQFFKIVDQNSDKNVELKEFHCALLSLDKNITQADSKAVFSYFDESGDGKLEIDELRKKLKRSGVLETNRLEKLIQILYDAICDVGLEVADLFKIFDSDKSNSLTHKELIHKIQQYEIAVDAQTIQELFELYDIDNDGVITQTEWNKIFHKQIESAKNGKQSVQMKLNWKQRYMIEIADFCSLKKITIHELFKYIDQDPDNSLSRDEFKKLFQYIKLKDLSEQDIEDIYNDIDDDQSGEISYTEFMKYIQQAQLMKKQVEKIEQINEKINKIKQEERILIEQQSNKQYSQEGRDKIKISLLEINIKRTQKQNEELQKEIQEQYKTICVTKDRYDQLDEQFYKATKNHTEYKETILQQKYSDDRKNIDNQIRKISDLENKLNKEKAATTTYKSLYEQQQKYSIALKNTYERETQEKENKDDVIKQLQSTSDEKCLIGKLYHKIMLQKYNDLTAKDTYKNTLAENKNMQIEVDNLQFENDQTNLQLYECNRQFIEDKQNFEGQVSELRNKIIPGVNPQKIDNMYNQIQEVVKVKNDLDRQNKEIISENYKVKAINDANEYKMNNLQYTHDQLKSISNNEGIEKEFIKTRLEMNTIKYNELQAMNQLHITQEKCEYLNRLNIQATEFQKDLQDQIGEKNKQFQERESFWIKKFREQSNQLLQQKKEDQHKQNRQAKLQQYASEKYSQEPKENYLSNEGVSVQESKVESRIDSKIIVHTRNNSNDNEVVVEKQKLHNLQNNYAKVQKQLIDLQQQVNYHQQISQNQIQSSQSDIKDQNHYQLQQMHKNVLQQEHEKMAEISRQANQTLQQMNQDKKDTIERREHQIEQMKKEYIQEKHKDSEKIRELNQQIHNLRNAKENENNQSYMMNSGKVFQSQQNLGEFKKLLSEKEDKIQEYEQTMKNEENNHKETKNKLMEKLRQIKDLEYDIEIYKESNQSQKLKDKTLQLQEKIKQLTKLHNDQKAANIKLKEDFLNETRNISDKEKQFYQKYMTEKTQSQNLQQSLKQALDKIQNINKEISQVTKENETTKIELIETKSRLQAINKEDRESKNKGSGKNNEITLQQKIENLEKDKKFLEKQIKDDYKLQEEIVQLKISEAKLKGEKCPDIFDNGDLVYSHNRQDFRSEGELCQTISKWMKYNPDSELFKDLNKSSKNGHIERNQFLTVLQQNGIRLKNFDINRIVDKRLSDKNGCIDMVNFIYLCKGNVQSNGVMAQLKPSQNNDTVRFNEENVNDLNSTSQNKDIYSLQQELNKTLNEKKNLEKENKIMKGDFVSIQTQLESNQKDKSLGEMKDKDVLFQTFKLQDTIHDLKNKLDGKDQELRFKSSEIIKLNEEKSQIIEDLRDAQDNSQQYQEKYEKFANSKLDQKDLQNEIIIEKDVIIKTMKVKLDDFRKREKQLQNKLVDLEYKSEELKTENKNNDQIVFRFTKRIKELQEQKEYLETSMKRAGSKQELVKKNIDPKNNTLTKKNVQTIKRK